MLIFPDTSYRVAEMPSQRNDPDRKPKISPACPVVKMLILLALVALRGARRSSSWDAQVRGASVCSGGSAHRHRHICGRKGHRRPDVSPQRALAVTHRFNGDLPIGLRFPSAAQFSHWVLLGPGQLLKSYALAQGAAGWRFPELLVSIRPGAPCLLPAPQGPQPSSAAASRGA